MSEVPELTLDFLGKHTREAAQVLQSLPLSSCGDFLMTVPSALAAKLVEYMPFDRVALLITAMPAPEAKRILENMNAGDAAAALRLVSGPSLDRLLAELPETKRKMFRHQKQYPAHTVGAWMDAGPIEIGETLNIVDIRRWLRQQNRSLEHGLFIVTPQGRVSGVLTLSQLALAKNSLPVRKLMTTGIQPLADRAQLESVRNLDDWERFTALPVINHKQKLVGALTRRNLERALSLSQPASASVKVLPLFGEMFKGFLEGMIHVVDWLVKRPSVENDPSTGRK